MEKEITIDNLISEGFEEEIYKGKTFYRKQNGMVTFIESIGKWVPCNPETHCFYGYVDSIEQIYRLMEEGKK